MLKNPISLLSVREHKADSNSQVADKADTQKESAAGAGRGLTISVKSLRIPIPLLSVLLIPQRIRSRNSNGRKINAYSRNSVYRRTIPFHQKQ